VNKARKLSAVSRKIACISLAKWWYLQSYSARTSEGNAPSNTISDLSINLFPGSLKPEALWHFLLGHGGIAGLVWGVLVMVLEI